MHTYTCVLVPSCPRSLVTLYTRVYTLFITISIYKFPCITEAKLLEEKGNTSIYTLSGIKNLLIFLKCVLKFCHHNCVLFQIYQITMVIFQQKEKNDCNSYPQNRYAREIGDPRPLRHHSLVKYKVCTCTSA